MVRCWISFVFNLVVLLLCQHPPIPRGTNIYTVSVTNNLDSNEIWLFSGRFADNYLFTGVWGNGVYDCGTSQCSNSFSNWNVANYDYHGGWYGWKINFNSNRNGQSSVATNFKNRIHSFYSKPYHIIR